MNYAIVRPDIGRNKNLDWNEECIMLVDKRLRLNWQEINRL